MFGDNNQNQPAQDTPTMGQPAAPDNNPNYGYGGVQPQQPQDTPQFGVPSGPPAVSDNQDIAQPEPQPQAHIQQQPQSNELLGLKQEALQQLTPLVGQLDQEPEEKFKTLMMMIQASDDHTKLQEAFDTAKQISDEKVRAKAILDVINEINYFTQHHNDQTEQTNN